MTEIVQGTPEWRAVRLGRVTASRVADVVAKTKSGPGASRANYMAELLVERLTGQPAERFQNDAMRWGADHEPAARQAYEFLRECAVEQVGFVHHPRIAMAGASPDGLVGADGLLELKCPNTATHVDTLLGQAPPGKYVIQMQWQMACTGRAWCDFGSFDPRLPYEMQLWVSRVMRDETHIRELEAEVEAFLAELDDKARRLRTAYNLSEAA